MSSLSSIHQGHRVRMKERFCREGLDNFNDINALELLLFYCVQRKDTNPLAHRLLEQFGSFSKVLDASRDELMQVEGVTENIAVYLSLMRDMSRYYNKLKQNEQIKVVGSVTECAQLLRPNFIGRKDEVVFVLCLDAKCQVICCDMVSQGTANSAPFPFRKVVELMIKSKAASVIISHNHPGGIAVPSPEDIAVTKRLAGLLSDIEVVLVDHIVFADDGDYVSMVQSNYFDPRYVGAALEKGGRE